MSFRASTTTTSELLRPMAPPALPRNAFFIDRDFASKIGKSTQALCVEMFTCSVIAMSLNPVGTRARYLRSASKATAHPTTVIVMTMYQW